ncbi:hypothetical protein, partial [Mesorhizobium sp. M1378]|uniref:hypothetical protein n=1 Tax=Mesorhizobium sp. M1378 TaxID=2957092 RepID=UPI003335CBFD
MALFSNGIGTAEELKAALQFRLESELRRHGQRLSRLAENRSRCLIPGFDGSSLSSESKDALWARFCMGA